MDLQKLQAPLEAQLALLGFELVYLESAKEGRDSILRLYIDHLDHGPEGDRGITLDDCVAANDGLVVWMDVEFPSLREDLALEISSPGLERPLTKPEHYRRFAGRLCRIQTRMPLNGQKRFKGWIGEATETEITIEEDNALKTIPYELIQKARLAPFDEDGAPPPRIVQRGKDLRAITQDSENDLSPEGEEEGAPPPRIVKRGKAAQALGTTPEDEEIVPQPRTAALAATHQTVPVEKSAD